MKLLVIFLSLIFSTTSWAMEGRDCHSRSARIKMLKYHTQEFISSLRLISSMPLDGYEEGGRDGDFVVVRVFVPMDYGEKYEIDSFDVAKKMVGFARFKKEWHITYIEASVCSISRIEEDLSNAGSIGHGGKRGN